MFVFSLNNSHFRNLNLDTEEFLNVLSKIAHDLSLIKKQCDVEEVVLHGGAVLGLLLGKAPKDWDLIFKPKSNQNKYEARHIATCIRSIKNYKIFKGGIDAYSSTYAIEWISPLELVVGYYSDHTEYFSMFAVTHAGEIVTNKIAWNDLLNRTYRINKNGWLFKAWWYKIGCEDKRRFYLLLDTILIRVAYYSHKYHLTIEEETKHFLKQTIPYVEKLYGEGTENKNLFDSYAQKKGFTDFASVLSYLRSKTH